MGWLVPFMLISCIYFEPSLSLRTWSSFVNDEISKSVALDRASATVETVQSMRRLNSVSITEYAHRSSASRCDQGTRHCYNGGVCQNGLCHCAPGWTGDFCQSCSGRVMKTKNEGLITDGPLNYTRGTQCIWLLQDSKTSNGRATAVFLELKFHQFTTQCSWDHLYVFDGDSVFSKQLLAMSGKFPAHHIRYFALNSTVAYVYFSGEFASNLTGFNISYKFYHCPESCINECSSSVLCKSCPEYISSQCSNETKCYSLCKNGQCGQDGACSCKSGFKGEYCDLSSGEVSWLELKPSEIVHNGTKPMAVAGFGLVTLNRSFWVLGGYSFEQKQNLTAFRYDVTANTWHDLSTLYKDGSLLPKNRYDHSAVVHGDKIYIFGGLVDYFNVTNEMWSLDTKLVSERGSAEPKPNALWSRVHQHGAVSGATLHQAPLHVYGHTAHVVNSAMLVFFGYNPYKSFASLVQEFSFVNNTWSILETSGAKLPGLYGHTSTIDSQNNIYIYGGYSTISTAFGKANDHLYLYQPIYKKWSVLPRSRQASFLSSMGLVNNLLIVVGGNPQNETFMSKTSCFTHKVLVYDTDCNVWNELEMKNDNIKLCLFGHKSLVYKNEMYIFGGFDGDFSNRLRKLSPGECLSFRDKTSCLNRAASKAIKCTWSKERCVSKGAEKIAKSAPPSGGGVELFTSLPNESSDAESQCGLGEQAFPVSQCKAYFDCQTCTSVVDRPCRWCGDLKLCDSECPTSSLAIKSFDRCPASGSGVNCSQFHTCNSCKFSDRCIWDRRTKSQNYACVDPSTIAEKVDPTAALLINKGHIDNLCYKPCPLMATCDACSKAGCVWCANMKRCVDANSYISSFPYGQCMQLSFYGDDCTETAAECQSFLTCDQCRSVGPRCGWCDDGSQTGLGRCMEGGSSGPVQFPSALPHQAIASTNRSLCSQNRWHFLDCPRCQCNGHSKCAVSSPTSSLHNQSASLESARDWDDAENPPLQSSTSESVAFLRHRSKANIFFASSTPRPLSNSVTLSRALPCLSCAGQTHGDQCENCIDGFYGNALNGGNCTPCECNGHASRCHHLTGKCYCTTRGITGHNCDKCDAKYIGNPSNGTCFYDLVVDFMFQFSMNKDEDKYLNTVNFVARPPKPDVDVMFKLSCDGLAVHENSGFIDLNITNDFDVARNLAPRRLLKGFPCHDIQRTFSSDDFSFGTDMNTTFFISVYGFKTPQVIKISFQQTQAIDWMRFFVTFALCFFVLLVSAFVTWKIKQKFDIYRRRQRLFVELAQMASRPFGTVDLDWTSNSSKKKPTIVAVEPCADYRAAVVTVAFRMPTGGAAHTPAGQSGLALGSTLCYMGPNQLAQLQTPPSPVPEEKRKRRRPACIS